nr:acyl-CoA oxidase 3 [Schizochytrium sp. HX-308]
MSSEDLQAERAKATFNVEQMTHVLNGGAAETMKRRWIMDAHADAATFVHAEHDREEQIGHAVSHFMEVHKPHFDRGYIPRGMDMQHMSDARMTSSALTINFGVFSSCLRSNCSDDQKAWWLEKAQVGKIIGAYAQTELAHGTFVRGLLTRATYLPSSQEWEIHTPSVDGIKWWITGLPLATHAVVFADTYVAGKSVGQQWFMVQLRGAGEDKLELLPGIEVGDVGETLGERDATIGYLRLDKVRIPRRHLLEKRAHVTPQGEWVSGPEPGSMDPTKAKKPKAGKSAEPVTPKMQQALKYVTMMGTRIALASTAAGALAKACVIATRYSSVRRQGYAQDERVGPETQIIDFSVQRFRLLKWISTAYAFKAATQWMVRRRREVTAGGEVNLDDLPETHATGAGLKALTTTLAADGIEDLRRCCGGHGFLMSSGIAPLEADFKGPNTTAEGDAVVLSLQTARFLIKSYEAAKRGEVLSGLTACLAPLGEPEFDPVQDGRKRLGLDNRVLTASSLQDPSVILALFEWRSLVVISRAGAHLDAARKAMGPGRAGEAWNQTARILYAATRCHVRYFILVRFQEVIAGVEDAACRKALERMFALVGVIDLLEGEQWLGLVDAEALDAAEQASQALCEALRPDAVALVDAWDYPDRVLNSTLGRFDGNAYQALYEEAKRSRINRNAVRTVPSFLKRLEKYIDKDALEPCNKHVPASAVTSAKL